MIKSSIALNCRPALILPTKGILKDRTMQRLHCVSMLASQQYQQCSSRYQLLPARKEIVVILIISFIPKSVTDLMEIAEPVLNCSS